MSKQQSNADYHYQRGQELLALADQGGLESAAYAARATAHFAAAQLLVTKHIGTCGYEAVNGESVRKSKWNTLFG